MEMALKFEVPI